MFVRKKNEKIYRNQVLEFESHFYILLCTSSASLYTVGWTFYLIRKIFAIYIFSFDLRKCLSKWLYKRVKKFIYKEWNDNTFQISEIIRDSIKYFITYFFYLIKIKLVESRYLNDLNNIRIHEIVYCSYNFFYYISISLRMTGGKL